MKSSIGKNSYCAPSSGGHPLQQSPPRMSGVQQYDIPDAHRRHSVAKLSLLSGAAGQLSKAFNELLISGSQYEESDSNFSSASPSLEKGTKVSGGSNGGTVTNQSSNQSAFKANGMRLIPTDYVDEESFESEEYLSDDDSMLQDDEEADPALEFNPKNFYWLFNPDLKFNRRPGFSIEDDISSQDFMSMRRLNRQALTEFFKDRISETQVKAFRKQSFKRFDDSCFASPLKSAVKGADLITHPITQHSKTGDQLNDPEGFMVGFGMKGIVNSEQRQREEDDEMMNCTETEQLHCKSSLPAPQKLQQASLMTDTTSLMWEDAAIDREAKRFLKKKENGRFLPMDIVSHLEFFFNTLLMSHETTNPFKRPQLFQALLYPLFTRPSYIEAAQGGNTILEIHRRLIFPLQFEQSLLHDELFDSPCTEDSFSQASLDERKYDWYPNREIDQAISTQTVSPTPKRFEPLVTLYNRETGETKVVEEGPATKRKHQSTSFKSFENPDPLKLQVRKTDPAERRQSKLSKAFRRHTVVLLNPITEKQQSEEMEFQ